MNRHHVDLLAVRIRAARAAMQAREARRDMSVEAKLWKRAREVFVAGRDPQEALHDALQDVAYTHGSAGHVRGYAIATTRADAVELPKELLGARVSSFAVASAHYQPQGSRWAVQVLFIVYTEAPGGST